MEKQQHQESAGQHGQADKNIEKQGTPNNKQDEKVPVQVHDDRAFSFNNGMR